MEDQGHVATAQHNYGFQLLHTVPTHDGTQVCEYKSKSTGLTVLFAPLGGPYIRASFVIPTEYCDNDGLPYAVENLIAMGSKQHPYQNLLQTLTENNLDSRSLGLTDTDYTSFELTCVESNVFLKLLPLYMDHILNPAFTEEAFLTEIHHIDGQGKDGGAMYEQAVAIARMCYSFSFKKLVEALYPSDSGYAYNSNGYPATIRESVTLEKIKQYHKQYYHTANLKVNIIGNIDQQSVLEVLAQFDNKPEGVFKRPWQKPIRPMSGTQNLVYQYPEDDDECTEGYAYVAWRGPSVLDQYMFTAIQMFLKYLTDSPDGKMFKEFVEIQDRYASKLYYTYYHNSETFFYLFFGDVPVNKLPEMQEKVFTFLENCIDNFDDSDIDILKTAIQSEKSLYWIVRSENPHNQMEFRLAEYAVHGITAKDLEAKVNLFKHLNELLNESKSFWINVARKYLIESYHVVLQCFPGRGEEKNELKEETRIKNQIERLRAETLEEYGEILQEAKNSQQKPPEELINSFGKIGSGSINFFKLTRYSSDSSNQRINLSKTPVFTYFDDLEQSGIVSIFALLDSSTVAAENRKCLPLLLQTIFQSPLRRSDTFMPKEIVLREQKKSLLTSKSCFGLNPQLEDWFQCGKYSNTLMVMIQVEADNYDVGIGWMRDILYNLEFAIDDVKIVAARMLEEVTSLTSLGAEITRHSLYNLIYVKDCNIVQNGLLLQQEFLETVTEDTINKMRTTWKHLIDPKNVALHIVGSLDRIKEPERALDDFLPEHIEPFQNKPQVISDVSYLSKTQTSCAVIGIDKDLITVSYLISSVESINSYDNPDLPLLLLYLEYLTAFKAKINKRSRSLPTVTFHMKLEPHKGLLFLRFNTAHNVFQPYNKIKEKILEHIKNREWNDSWLNKAKRTLARGFIRREVVVNDVTRLAVQSNFQKVDYTNNRTMLHKVLSATTCDLDEVGSKYLPELFNPCRAKIAIVTVPSKTQEIADSFKSLGFTVEISTR